MRSANMISNWLSTMSQFWHRACQCFTIRWDAKYSIRRREASRLKQESEAKGLKRKISRQKKRSAELDTLIKTLYESYAMGKITEKRFEMLSADYEKEQAELEEVIAADVNDGEAAPQE